MSEQSMEEFGPVALDYFNQRRVEDVVLGEGGQGHPVWTIKYEGGGLLHNYDPAVPMPNVKGAGQTMVILTDKVTEVRFGLEPVYLNPIEYAIVDPVYTKGHVVYAQRSRVNMPKTPPHPDERIAEGPEEFPEPESV